MSVWRARETRTIETYGSARWATPREVRRAGLLGPDGVVLGRHGRAYLRHDGPEHVLCFAPTRSGKGVGLVVPTLLTWPGSGLRMQLFGQPAADLVEDEPDQGASSTTSRARTGR
jgi:type IV secretion system protein VirD4